MFLRKKVYQKLYLILGQILIFSFIYYFLEDEEFGGINVVQELIREEIVKKHLEDELPESFQNYPGQQQITNLDPRSEKELEKETTQVVKETTQEIKEIVKPSPFQDYFNRFYFSMVTGTTLGYGDIYPISNRCKIVAMLQLLTTLFIVVS